MKIAALNSAPNNINYKTTPSFRAKFSATTGAKNVLREAFIADGSKSSSDFYNQLNTIKQKFEHLTREIQGEAKMMFDQKSKRAVFAYVSEKGVTLTDDIAGKIFITPQNLTLKDTISAMSILSDRVFDMGRRNPFYEIGLKLNRNSK